jgi:hypothetical protein
MRNLITAAAILAATAAQAGYFERVPSGSEYHYEPSPQERQQMIQQRQHNEVMRELEYQRRHTPKCTEFALPNGQLASHCE